VIATRVGALPESWSTAAPVCWSRRTTQQPWRMPSQSLLADSELRARMGREGRCRAEKMFDLEEHTRRIVEVLKSGDYDCGSKESGARNADRTSTKP